MKKFDHPNVLTLLGVCIDAGPFPYVVMPFMAHGSLKAYFKDHSSELIMTEYSSMDDVLLSSTFLYFITSFLFL